MARYFVTGGAGFIGSNIARGLVRQGQDVVVFDNLSTGSRDNLADILGSIEFVEGDIKNLPALTEIMAGTDFVLHQAALRAVERSVDDPLETNDNNITGTLNVLLAAREAKVQRVVFASSSSIYGNQAQERQVETLPPAPASPYALSKLAGEHYCRLFSELFNVPTVCLRYFNVFGPYQNPQSKYSAVIPIFVQQLMTDTPPDIHWHGEQSRDFTYVDNVVSANLLAAASQNVGRGEILNIGNGENISVNDLYGEIQKLLGKEVTPRRTEKRAGDVLKTYADISRAKELIGYQPVVTFAEGLARSIAWYKKNL